MDLLSVSQLGCIWAGLATRQQVLMRNTVLQKTKELLPQGSQHKRKTLTVVFNDSGLLLVVILLDTMDLNRYLGIDDGVFAFVYLGQLLARDDLSGKQRKRSEHR